MAVDWGDVPAWIGGFLGALAFGENRLKAHRERKEHLAAGLTLNHEAIIGDGTARLMHLRFQQTELYASYKALVRATRGSRLAPAVETINAVGKGYWYAEPTRAPEEKLEIDLVKQSGVGIGQFVSFANSGEARDVDIQVVDRGSGLAVARRSFPIPAN
jgi:hypothetical protein